MIILQWVTEEIQYIRSTVLNMQLKKKHPFFSNILADDYESEEIISQQDSYHNVYKWCKLESYLNVRLDIIVFPSAWCFRDR